MDNNCLEVHHIGKENIKQLSNNQIDDLKGKSYEILHSSVFFSDGEHVHL